MQSGKTVNYRALFWIWLMLAGTYGVRVILTLISPQAHDAGSLGRYLFMFVVFTLCDIGFYWRSRRTHDR